MEAVVFRFRVPVVVAIENARSLISVRFFHSLAEKNTYSLDRFGPYESILCVTFFLFNAIVVYTSVETFLEPLCVSYNVCRAARYRVCRIRAYSVVFFFSPKMLLRTHVLHTTTSMCVQRCVGGYSKIPGTVLSISSRTRRQ